MTFVFLLSATFWYIFESSISLLSFAENIIKKEVKNKKSVNGNKFFGWDGEFDHYTDILFKISIFSSAKK